MAPITFRGRTQSLPAWSRELGIPESTLRSRLGKLGQSVDEALGTPADARFRPTPNPVAIKPVKPPPPMKRHVSGMARVRWTEAGRSREQYLGVFGTEAANRSYARFCAEWYANRGNPPPPQGEVVSVANLAMRYLEWVEGYYRKNGRITSEVYAIRATVARLNSLYGGVDVGAFSAASLRALQASMVTSGLSMSTANGYVARIVRCFSWGVERGLVIPAIADALKHVRALAPGRTTAPASVPIVAAPDDAVERIIEHLHEDPARCAMLAAMVRVQRLSGMRPGELCELRSEDVDRTRVPWLYCPASGGKTLHLEKGRRIWFGPKARAILGPMLDKASESGGKLPVFHFTRRRGGGVVAVSARFYRDCVADACKRAGVKRFAPNQLRHARATEIQRRYEDDGATAAALGNSPEVARQVYTDHPADAVAKRIAEECG